MSTTAQEIRLTAPQMRELLDRHMRLELEADVDGLMDTLGDNVVWGRDDDPYKLVGRKAIHTHYSGILAPGRHDAKRIRGWYDEEQQSSATEYDVTVNFEDGTSVTFPVLACVEFDNGRMKNEILYFYEGRTPSQVMPADYLQEQGAAFVQAKALSEEPS